MHVFFVTPMQLVLLVREPLYSCCRLPVPSSSSLRCPDDMYRWLLAVVIVAATATTAVTIIAPLIAIAAPIVARPIAAPIVAPPIIAPVVAIVAPGWGWVG